MTVPNSFISHSQFLGMKPEKCTKFARPWPLVSGDFKSRDLFRFKGFPIQDFLLIISLLEAQEVVFCA